MRRSTIGLVVAGTLVVAAGAAVIVQLPRYTAGAVPAQWPTETLTPDQPAALPYALHVTPAGCPGFTVSSPVPEESRNVPGSGSYVVTLAPEHHALWVCLGTTDAVGRPRDTVSTQVGTHDGVTGLFPTLVTTPHGEAVRIDRAFGPDAAPRLTDWLVDHGGYTYAFGYLHPVEAAQHYETVEAMIASVVWDG